MIINLDRLSLVESVGRVSNGVYFSAVTAADVSDDRTVTTYASGGSQVSALGGIGANNRKMTITGTVAEQIIDQISIARVTGQLRALMESHEPVRFVSPVASIPRGILESVKMHQSGLNAIEVTMVIREIRQLDVTSRAGKMTLIKRESDSKVTPSKIKTQSQSGITVPSDTALRKAQAQLNEANKNRSTLDFMGDSLLLKAKNSVSDLMTGASNLLRR